ncbi:MAG: helix-turn-helix domain-containing protein [Armatimonadota bacterium]|nr:helix-turn-helix domain-containing protein [Armatimonadota bacterium]MDR7452063.1 helix-turn-helix domain-containing protein [Armatimonadota bacterium]MDR7466525.1 helix-turn-helix domain-containing protein [Armatimonadota bacterium]MDR7493247.1 helix-turn-helix domain-containing protein [Armatimonadota bacterium]MDR7499860.1 helix-turn-helix domain-containing protein [Armatimonadota bacterium]
MTTDLMTVEQVAAYLQLNKLTVYRYIREGRIPAARLGKAYRIRKADVDAFLERSTVRGQPPAAARPRRSARLQVAQRASRVSAEEIAVAPGRREVPETHPELTINPMEWVIRGLH